MSSFPKGVTDLADSDRNPAIQVFGRRFFKEQNPTELLVEFLLVVSSKKRVAFREFSSALPSLDQINNWPTGAALEYAPTARLNLKLFAFIGASKLETRHEAHRTQYSDLLSALLDRMKCSNNEASNEALRTLQNLFLGFHGSGANRTWCAQTFLPLCRGLLAGETLWNETQARKKPVDSWMQCLVELRTYFTMNKHRFLARGGELLYLQVCNALRQPEEQVREWARSSGISLDQWELSPAKLLERLESALDRILYECPPAISELADFIDKVVEPETSAYTDFEDNDSSRPRFTPCGWCPEDSWREGYLFAIEILRLCEARLDIIDRTELLETACAMQELRSLAAQSSRICCPCIPFPGYRLAISDPEGSLSVLRHISRNTVKCIEKVIFRAIRSDVVCESKLAESDFKQADRMYAGKLYLSIAKRIGFMVPRRGRGSRFVLSEDILRYLVLTIVPAGGRIRYDTFKALIESRHGLVFEGDGLSRAIGWTGGSGWGFYGTAMDQWLIEMLEAAGMLRRLSDSCSLVESPVAALEPVAVGTRP